MITTIELFEFFRFLFEFLRLLLVCTDEMVEDGIAEANKTETDRVQTLQVEAEKKSANNNKLKVQKPKAEKHKKCIIVLEDIRENPLFERYLKRIDMIDEPVPDVPLKIVTDSPIELSPIEIPDSDIENSDNEEVANSSSSEPIIEISSDSD